MRRYVIYREMGKETLVRGEENTVNVRDMTASHMHVDKGLMHVI
jgi:hypothetical protein